MNCGAPAALDPWFLDQPRWAAITSSTIIEVNGFGKRACL